jgi:acetyl esterase
LTLDEATRRYLDECAQQQTPRLHEMSPSAARAFEASFRDRCGSGPTMDRETDIDIAVGTARITLRCLRPSPDARDVVLYFHGGGWVVGDIDDYVALGRSLAARSDATVVLANYRLAPEHPYPVAVEDAWSAACWVEDHLAELTNAQGGRIVVAGDSAGGCLSAVVAQRARRRGTPRLALQVLIYPVTDCDFTTRSYQDEANQLRVSADTMRWFWDLYAPDEDLRTYPDASPLRSKDLAGLPTAVIVTAEHDVLRDDGERYAALLQKAGVPVDIQEFAGQMHGFMSMLNILPASEIAIDYVARRIRAFLDTTPSAGAGRDELVGT